MQTKKNEIVIGERGKAWQISLPVTSRSTKYSQKTRILEKLNCIPVN